MNVKLVCFVFTYIQQNNTVYVTFVHTKMKKEKENSFSVKAL